MIILPLIFGQNEKEENGLTTYYKRLPETSYEEDILHFFDEKQWCPI
jgi:hypothetical protein